MVHERGIEVNPNRVKAIKEVGPPNSKVKLQELIGKINFLRRFISNLSGRIRSFAPLLRLKEGEEFAWGADQQKALDDIKEYLSKPPVLIAPQSGKPFKMYISAEDDTIVAVLAQEVDGKEHVIFYLSRKLIDAETRYPPIEKLCLSLYHACTKLRHYLLSAAYLVVCKTDIVKHILSVPILRGRLGKWAYALIEFDLRYESAKAVKG